MRKSRYLDRIKIPVNGSQSIILFTKCRLKIAKGYEKITIINKKPFALLLYKDVCIDNFYVPIHKEWQKTDKSIFVDYYSKDYCKVRLKYYKQTNKFFVSVFDLFCFNFKVID